MSKKHKLPSYVHALTIFFAAALYKHTVLFSKINYKKTEQWIESAVRIYLHDKSILQKKTTLIWLQKNKDVVWKNAEAIFSFEGIIHNKMSTKQQKEEENLLAAWNLFYDKIGKELLE